MLSVQQFLTKSSMTPVLHHPIHLILPRVTFFPVVVSPDGKSPQREVFRRCGRGETNNNKKTAETLKGIKINKFKNCSEQWENVSVGVLNQMESTLKVTKV